jgi:ATP-dependent DNA helicase RecG
VLFQRLKIYANNPLTIGEMGIGHEDTKELDALREALVNLLIHSDYFSPMKPRIRVFTNRIEFENPGMLPRTVEQLLKADESYPRNPVLAKLFRIARLCETAGYGFDKMLEWKKQTGNAVLFETAVDKTKFTFMLSEKTAKKIAKNGTVNVKSGTESKKTIEKTSKSIEKSIEKTSKSAEKSEKGIENTSRSIEKNSKSTEKILKFMSENPFITTAQLSKIIGISIAAINKHIAKLKKQNMLRRDGADKGGKWVVIDNGHD